MIDPATNEIAKYQGWYQGALDGLVAHRFQRISRWTGPAIVVHAFNKAQSVWAKRRYLRALLIRIRLLWRMNNSPSVTSPRSSKVYIDVSSTVYLLRLGWGIGGIGKVALRLAASAIESGSAIPVFVERSQLFIYNDRKEREIVLPEAGDTFIIIDRYWDAFRKYPDLILDMKRSGVFIFTCIHDLIPLYFPRLSSPDVRATMQAYLPLTIRSSNALVSVSEASAEEIRCYIARNSVGEKQIRVYSFSLAFEKQSVRPQPSRESFRSLFDDKAFLSVGSLMSHKCQVVAVEAMELLWQAGYHMNYVIIGEHCQSDVISDRIMRSSQFGKYLHWIRDATDAEIEFAYQNCVAVIQASLAEGFGLPIIEALSWGAPIIATDLQVFREIAGDVPTYFSACDVGSLARTTVSIMVGSENRTPPLVTFNQSWTESLSLLLNAAEKAKSDALG